MLRLTEVKAANMPVVFYLDVSQRTSGIYMGFISGLDAIETLNVQ